MEVQPAGFPVGIKCASAKLCGEPTDIIISVYNDVIVLIVSQLGSVGTMLLAAQDSTMEGKTTFNTSILVGKRNEPLLHIAARQLVELSHRSGSTKLECSAENRDSLPVISQALGYL